jgi:hypothetical protein
MFPRRLMFFSSIKSRVRDSQPNSLKTRLVWRFRALGQNHRLITSMIGVASTEPGVRFIPQPCRMVWCLFGPTAGRLRGEVQGLILILALSGRLLPEPGPDVSAFLLTGGPKPRDWNQLVIGLHCCSAPSWMRTKCCCGGRRWAKQARHVDAGGLGRLHAP